MKITEDKLDKLRQSMSVSELKKIILKKIKQEKRNDPISYSTGRNREIYFRKALKSLKKEGKVRDFITTGPLSFSDLKKGVDFYVIAITGSKYEVFPFSITGKRWVEEHKKKHPENIIFSVELKEKLDSLKERIMAVIKNGDLN